MADTSSGVANIKPISRASIHRICSGQGILSLAAAVKELIENSLDCGASKIDIRLKEYGADLIEVADNGPGVSPDCYQALTLKYHTSKITEYADLNSLSSFGFRGEALSSLCALAKVTITTRTRDDPIAARLEYDHSGAIVSQSCVARCIGTTVSVALLFSPLPVRLKEFKRNVKREYTRLVAVLQAYGLIAKRVRLLCTNQSGKAGRTTVVQTHGSLSMRENILSLFGTKTLSCLEWMDLAVSDGCRVEGFFSKPRAGTGRSSGDRQFFFVNGRPVDMSKAAKLLNELYREFNSLQFPMVVLNFFLPTTAYDVNVTPDKRKIFLHDEKDLMAALMSVFRKAYTPKSVGAAPVSAKVPLSAELPIRSTERTSATHKPDFEEGGSSGGLEEDDDVDREGGSIREAPPMDERENEKSKDADRASQILKSSHHKLASKMKDNFRQAGVSTTSAAPRPPRTSPVDKQEHQTVQGRLTSFLSTSKRSSDDASRWPLLKKCKSASRSGPDDSTSMEGRDEISNEVEETFQTRSLRQGRLDDQLFEFRNSRKSDDCKGATSSVLEGGMKDPEGSRGNLGDRLPRSCDIGSPSQGGEVEEVPPDMHRNQSAAHELPQVSSISNEPGDRLPSTSHLFAAGKEKWKSRIPGPLGVKGAAHELPRVASTTNEHGDRLPSTSHLFEAGREKWKSKVAGTQGLKGAVSVLRFNRLAATEVEEAVRPKKKISVIAFDMESLRKKHNSGLLRYITTKGMKASKTKRSYTCATLGEHSLGKTRTEKEAALAAATKELEQNFTKADFKHMKVLGQFDLHFIVAKLDQDVFILDQHASDEKYHFEHLIRTAVLNRQQLSRPVPLDLPAADEKVVATQMETFRQNGFDFLEDKEAPPGRRLQLTAAPACKNLILDTEDVQELISLLANQPDIPSEYSDTLRHQGYPRGSSSWLPRLSRVRAVFASEACKSAIRIGDALSKKEMEDVVSRLADLEVPWSCPHGKPTIRHVVDLGSIVKL